jgi:alpha-beta hydrolase superfamily lysophospholipase
MLTRAEKFFKGFDKTKLFLQTWENPKAKATVLITHGQAEHSDAYLRLVDGLSQHLDLNFIGWDLRGHGKSDGLRGYAADFDNYVLDYDCFVEEVMNLPLIKNKPIFVLGHSMGGLIQSCALVEKKYTQFAAQVLSSPLFGLELPVPVWKSSAADLVNRFIPKLTLGNEIKFDRLTRDLSVISEYEKDLYRHDKISTGVFLGIKREVDKIKSRGPDITLPTFLNISDHDPIISTKDALEFFESIGSLDKRLKMIEGAKHELYNDTCREEVFQAVAEFLKEHIK